MRSPRARVTTCSDPALDEGQQRLQPVQGRPSTRRWWSAPNDAAEPSNSPRSDPIRHPTRVDPSPNASLGPPRSTVMPPRTARQRRQPLFTTDMGEQAHVCGFACGKVGNDDLLGGQVETVGERGDHRPGSSTAVPAGASGSPTGPGQHLRRQLRLRLWPNWAPDDEPTSGP